MGQLPQAPGGPALGPPGAQQKNGLAIAGMVLGIVSLATAWVICCPAVATVTGLVGLGLSLGGRSKARKRGGAGAGAAKAGLVCSICGIMVPVVVRLIYAGYDVLPYFSKIFGRAARQAATAPAGP